MSRIDDRSARLAGELFDEFIVPIAEMRRGSGAQLYFPTGFDPTAASYFSTPSIRTMTPADLEFPDGGSADGVINVLASLWTAQGETELAALAPHFREIADALSEERTEADGEVDILCYTLF